MYTVYRIQLQYPIGGIGDMFALFREHGCLPNRAVQIYGAELGLALDFLHNNGVVYRDLKLENIVLDSLGHVRVVDFGLSKQLLNGEYTATICGTLQYMSPDVACEKPYSHYVDWWSLAVLLHILATGRYPYPNANATHHQELRFVDYSTPLECEHDLGGLFDEMLVPSFNKRLCTFDAFRKHDFFKSIDFEDVLALRYNPLDEILRKDDNSDTTSIVDWDSEESMEAFGENYEFENFDYFNDEV
ncbi:unnamed protein product [Cylicocyclus nassatus]|uniref:Protein kinase domain-containing protein n=1 Tax=Cylicocyclus nassatus TaxID=53992 RepID=A0AA36GXD0_CYLNA|nr:unnamed protein product [Cylicocyclus nassatus]